MTEIIDKDDVKNKEIKNGIQNNRKCSICGSGKTGNNWYKYRDIEGRWNTSSYLCNICYNTVCDERRGYYKLKNEKYLEYKNRKCVVCEIIGTGVNRRYKDKDGKWDGKNYICNSCYGKMWNNDNRRSDSKYLTIGYEECDKDYLGLLGECIIATYLDIRNCKTCDILSLNRHKQCELEYKV